MVGKREKRFCQKNVKLLVAKLTILSGTPMITYWGKPSIRYIDAPIEAQRKYWHRLLDILRECNSRANAEKHRARNLSAVPTNNPTGDYDAD